ncbi:MAG: T9SS type A sorting domain-containing protein [Bacteroidota bacterium]|nr:T9SS type A sorting domain-containing protein [Bacteroidota bacterium]
MKYIFKNLTISWLLCLLVTIACAQPNITRVEYYIDTDPGFGNATTVSITASADIQNKVIAINPVPLSSGVHRMYVRARDANGSWSLTNTLLFYKPYGTGTIPPPPPPPTNITKIEYYIDNDPGFGKATNLTITASTDIQNAIIAINPSALAVGVHRLYIRARNANGNWSLTNTWLFYKPYGNGVAPPAPVLAKMDKLEYYIDTDPGYGNGVPVALDSLTNFADYVVPVNVTGLSTGSHSFWVRGLDKNGNWSMVNKWTFSISSVIAAPSIVVNSITDSTNCAADSFYVSYDKTGTYNAGNVFNVQLSDAAGSFTTPTTVGSYTGTGNAIVKVKLPSHVPDGTNYLLRVVSTNPVVTGIANAITITIHDRPTAQTVTGATDANTTFSYPYSVPAFTGSTWTWLAQGATITQTTNSANLVWNTAAKPQTIKIIETNQYGCVGDTSFKTVNVYNLAVDNVVPATLTPCPSGSLTITGKATGVFNSGNIFTAQLSSASGSFASPVNIGTVTANPIGLSQPVSINATLPFPLSNGTGYRVRIIASSPGVTGLDNGQDITINKPNLGADNSITISCANGSADITTLYNTSGYSNVVYSSATPTAATPGVYTLIVTNANGCKDTANITVLDASTATVPAAGSNSKIANRECTDAQGWTHYYYDNGTPTDYSDDIRLLSLKKNGNNIGSIGDGTFTLKVAATTGAGTNHAVSVNSPLVTPGSNFYSMNRYWTVTPTTQPSSPVAVRFYYNTQDLADVNGDDPQGPVTHTQLTVYKLQGGNSDPTTNWSGASGVTYYSSGVTPSLSNWVYTDLGNNRHQAEFLVSDFSGGGAGAVAMAVLPVTYVSFTASAQRDKVVLQWSTATELNSKEFSVQRSVDGVNFMTIATVPAAGNSNTIRYYSFDDLQSISLKGKVVFFRIVEADINGRLIYTGIKNVKIADGKNRFTLLYNPVTNEAVLNYESNEKEEALITVVDHLGRIVMTKQLQAVAGNNQIKLQTGNLAKGIYEVQLRSNKDQGTVRMMKE